MRKIPLPGIDPNIEYIINCAVSLSNRSDLDCVTIQTDFLTIQLSKNSALNKSPIGFGSFYDSGGADEYDSDGFTYNISKK